MLIILNLLLKNVKALCVDDPSWHKEGASKKNCEWVGKKQTTKRCSEKKSVENVFASEACLETCGTCPTCDAAEVNLNDFEVWRREAGYWYGEYSFFGADGDPFVSSSWNYPYDHYFGFIHIELDGPALKQRNVFIYPPQNYETCEQNNETFGPGVCGVNGNEKIFSADQSASDCDGNLAGPYVTSFMTLDTSTTILGDDTVIYTVKLPESFGGALNQNQLTTLPGNDVRVRTAQGFAFGTEAPSYSSFYREYKLANQSAWLDKLSQVRAANNILVEDHCAWTSSNAPSNITCEEHFL